MSYTTSFDLVKKKKKLDFYNILNEKVKFQNHDRFELLTLYVIYAIKYHYEKYI